MEADAPFSYDPFSLEAMADPSTFYPTLREEHPAYFMPQYDAWAITRYADVWAGFLDSEHFSEAEAQIFSREQLLVHNHGKVPAPVLDPVAIFNHLDPPLHTRFRQALAMPFLKGSVNRMTPAIETLIQARIKELEPRGSFDLNTDFASHVSAGAMCLMLGIPASEVPMVIRLVNEGGAREPGIPGFTKAGERAVGQLIGMVAEMVAHRRTGEIDRNHLMDALIAADFVGRPLTDIEISKDLVALLFGGTETLPKVFAGGLLELARRPDQLATVAGDPARNAPIAFEEMLRFSAPAQWFGRTVCKQTTLAGVTLLPGQRVILLIAAANRDPREFDNPDAFIWNRQARRMLSFGIGPHFCIGIHLARMEGQLMLRDFVKAFPRFQIDEAAGAKPASEFQVGWTSLPVRVLS